MQLPFETLTQFVALGLALIAGWFLGLASHSGGRKWRARLQEAEIEHARYRDLAEQDLRDAHRKIRALEEEKAQPAVPASHAGADAAAHPADHDSAADDGHAADRSEERGHPADQASAADHREADAHGHAPVAAEPEPVDDTHRH